MCLPTTECVPNLHSHRANWQHKLLERLIHRRSAGGPDDGPTAARQLPRGAADMGGRRRAGVAGLTPKEAGSTPLARAASAASSTSSTRGQGRCGARRRPADPTARQPDSQARPLASGAERQRVELHHDEVTMVTLDLDRAVFAAPPVPHFCLSRARVRYQGRPLSGRSATTTICPGSQMVREPPLAVPPRLRPWVAQIMLRLGHLLNSGCDQDP